MHEIFVIVRDAGDLVGPDRLLLEGMMRVTLGKEVLEEAHILETKQGDLMMRLVSDLRQRGILALQARLDTVPTSWVCLLTLEGRDVSVSRTCIR
jgi:hypothetical protein